MSWFKRGGQAIPSKPPARQPLVLALEPRVMFDGAAVATAAARTRSVCMAVLVALVLLPSVKACSTPAKVTAIKR